MSNKYEIYGYTQAMDGLNLVVNAFDDEMCSIKINNKETRWGLYCKPVKITIEEIDEKVIENMIEERGENNAY